MNEDDSPIIFLALALAWILDAIDSLCERSKEWWRRESSFVVEEVWPHAEYMRDTYGSWAFECWAYWAWTRRANRETPFIVEELWGHARYVHDVDHLWEPWAYNRLVYGHSEIGDPDLIYRWAQEEEKYIVLAPSKPLTEKELALQMKAIQKRFRPQQRRFANKPDNDSARLARKTYGSKDHAPSLRQMRAVRGTW
jgi:hypothetical protein